MMQKRVQWKKDTVVGVGIEDIIYKENTHSFYTFAEFLHFPGVPVTIAVFMYV